MTGRLERVLVKPPGAGAWAAEVNVHKASAVIVKAARMALMLLHSRDIFRSMKPYPPPYWACS